MARNTEGMSPPISHPTEGATVGSSRLQHPFQHSTDLGAQARQIYREAFSDSQFTFLIMHCSSSFMTNFDALLSLCTSLLRNFSL